MNYVKNQDLTPTSPSHDLIGGLTGESSIKGGERDCRLQILD